MAGAVETREELEGFRDAVPGADIVLARLAASLPVLEERVRARERGRSLEWHLRRAVELARSLEQAAIEDCLVQTDGRTVADVAAEIVARVIRPALPTISLPCSVVTPPRIPATQWTTRTHT